MPKDRSSPIPVSPASNEEQLTMKLKETQSTLKTCLTDYLPARQSCQDDIQSILALYDKIRQEASETNATSSSASGMTKLSNYHRSKLKTAYNNAPKNINVETEKIRACLDQINEIRRLREEKRRLLLKKPVNTPASGVPVSTSSNDMHQGLHRSQTSPTSISSMVARSETTGGGYGLRRGALMMLLQRAAAALPLWVGQDSEEAGDEAPPLCGAVPASAEHVCEPGDMVAVRAKVQSGDENWILTEVKKYDQGTGKYEVEDIDEEEKEKYVISRKKLIPLPRYRAHPQLNPSAVFELNAVVWALYPQTTCFYKGVVERRPAGPNDPYLIAFEDSSYPTGYSLPLGVPQRYVIAQD